MGGSERGIDCCGQDRWVLFSPGGFSFCVVQRWARRATGTAAC